MNGQIKSWNKRSVIRLLELSPSLVPNVFFFSKEKIVNNKQQVKQSYCFIFHCHNLVKIIFI